MGRPLTEMGEDPFRGNVIRLRHQPAALRRRVGDRRIFFDADSPATTCHGGVVFVAVQVTLRPPQRSVVAEPDAEVPEENVPLTLSVAVAPPPMGMEKLSEKAEFVMAPLPPPKRTQNDPDEVRNVISRFLTTLFCTMNEIVLPSEVGPPQEPSNAWLSGTTVSGAVPSANKSLGWRVEWPWNDESTTARKKT